MTQIRLALSDDDRGPERTRAKTLRLRGELEGALAGEGSAELARAPEAAAAGAKGDPVTIGAIVISLVSSGTLTALITSIFAHVKRERDEIEVTTPEGVTVKVNAGDLESEDKRAAIEDTIRRAVDAAGA